MRPKTPPAPSATAVFGAEQLALRVWAEILLQFGRGYEAATQMASSDPGGRIDLSSRATIDELNTRADLFEIFEDRDTLMHFMDPLLLAIRRAALKGTTNETQWSLDRGEVLKFGFKYGARAFANTPKNKTTSARAVDLALRVVRSECEVGGGGGPYCPK